jgi:hypothetical protein
MSINIEQPYKWYLRDMFEIGFESGEYLTNLPSTVSCGAHCNSRVRFNISAVVDLLLFI